MFTPQVSKERRKSNVITQINQFVPQIWKERRKANLFNPQLSKERRKTSVVVPQLSLILLANFCSVVYQNKMSYCTHKQSSLLRAIPIERRDTKNVRNIVIPGYKRVIFLIFILLYVLYSTLLHLPPLRFHCVGGCWDRTLDCCDFGIGNTWK